MRRLEGVHVALLTALDAGEHVDLDRTQALAAHLVDVGVHGVNVNGSTGEFAQLTTDERRAILEAAVDAVADRVPVTVQIAALSTADAVGHAEHALATGAHLGVLVSPYYEYPGDDGIIRYVQAVAAVGLPIMIYNKPVATGWTLSADQIERLADIDGVCAFKDTSPDAARLYRIRELVGDRLQLTSGQDSLALAAFTAAGTKAMVWGAANAIPEACLRLWELAVLQEDVGGARALWERMYPFARFIESHGYVPSLKAATALRGMPMGPCREPAHRLTTTELDELERLLTPLASVTCQPTPGSGDGPQRHSQDRLHTGATDQTAAVTLATPQNT